MPANALEAFTVTLKKEDGARKNPSGCSPVVCSSCLFTSNTAGRRVDGKRGIAGNQRQQCRVDGSSITVVGVEQELFGADRGPRVQFSRSAPRGTARPWLAPSRPPRGSVCCATFRSTPAAYTFGTLALSGGRRQRRRRGGRGRPSSRAGNPLLVAC